MCWNTSLSNDLESISSINTLWSPMPTRLGMRVTAMHTRLEVANTTLIGVQPQVWVDGSQMLVLQKQSSVILNSSLARSPASAPEYTSSLKSPNSSTSSPVTIHAQRRLRRSDLNMTLGFLISLWASKYLVCWSQTVSPIVFFFGSHNW